MAILPIITVPDPRLRKVSEPVARVDAEILTLLDDMLETMYDAPGIGLAAIQIAEPVRLITMDLVRKEGDGKSEPRAFINPEIVASSSEMNVYEEGCLSIPDFYDMVTRPASIRMRYLDRQGEARELHATGLLATCLQHEIDHLNGVLFIDRISRLKRQMALKKLEKQRKAA